MRWLLFRVLVIVLTLIFIIGAALTVGRAQPLSQRAMLLHLQDCQLPCWIGIVPGKTTINEARKLAFQVYGSPIEEGDAYLLFGNNDLQLRVAFNEYSEYAPDVLVQYISLSEYEHQSSITDFPMGEINVLLGPPDYIMEWGGEGIGFPALQYREYHSVMSFGVVKSMSEPIPSCAWFEPQLPFIGLEIFDDVPGSTLRPQRWYGFGKCYNLGSEFP